MDILVEKSELKGRVRVPVSKSETHRKLIAAAFTGPHAFERVCQAIGPVASDDIKATMECLKIISRGEDTVLDVYDSGTTLRFLMPITAALGKKYTFQMGESLSARPVDGLKDILDICRNGRHVTVSGKLIPGEYEVDGSVSSQYVSGMLYALSLLDGTSRLVVKDLSSAPYVYMTADIIRSCGIDIIKEDNIFTIRGKSRWNLTSFTVSGDWSAAAFYFVLNRLGADIEIDGLFSTIQGDSRIERLLDDVIVDISDIPDLAPPLALLGAGRIEGITLINADRLKIKESDRAEGIISILRSLGGRAEYSDENGGTLKVYGGYSLKGGECDCRKDHRLIILAVCLSYISEGTIYIRDAEFVSKSYPGFFDVFKSIGGDLKIEV